MSTILWFRRDLRLSDNPALRAAVARGMVIPVYIHDQSGPWPMGAASKWWLDKSLRALSTSLERLGSRLILRCGAALDILPVLARETGATAVMWNRRYDPHGIATDTALKVALKAGSIAVESFNASLLREPWTIQTGTGGPYKVFTPFWKACQAIGPFDRTQAAPAVIPAPEIWPRSEQIGDWGLHPTAPDWSKGFSIWSPGEDGARQRLDAFIGHALNRYAGERDRPDKAATSRLSPHLAFGEISPRQIVSATQMALEAGRATQTNADKFLGELGWREFSTHLLYHFPSLPEANFKPAFDGFAWAHSPEHLDRWRRGQTGYPLVDAGMRELWATGTMHNRVRMVAASFLIKHLRIDWRDGQRWFWDTLVDADLANNAASWQWVAGSGADAAPYFRIFNPMAQAEKFDPNGAYIRKWVPEHGTPCYPKPMVDHVAARTAALAAYTDIKSG